MSRLDELFARLPERLSVEQLATALGVKAPTAYRWLQEGLVPAYRIGGGGRPSWLILRDEVRDHLKSLRNIPDDPPGQLVVSGGEGEFSEGGTAVAGGLPGA
jgi:excisionase family DNA binding protein